MPILDKLNEACHEAGICEDGGKHIKYARLMEKEGSPSVVTGVWEDGTVSSCVFRGEDKECCYSSEPKQEDSFWSWISLLDSIGYKEHPLEAD